MDDKEAQNDEILALESILEENQFHITSSDQQTIGRVLVKPEITEKLTIQCNRNNQLFKADVEHLCPFELHFNFPADYPSANPPSFTLVCKWLRREQISKLCRKLDDKWNEVKGCVVLFEWLQFLQYEALAYLGIKETLKLPSNKNHVKVTHSPALSNSPDARNSSVVITPLARNARLDSRAVQDAQHKEDLFEFLIEYDKAEKQVAFDKGHHDCKVCFCEKIGSACMRFPTCDHIYCKECMKGYFEVLIADGKANSLSCPEEKCTSQASPIQVKELVSEEAFARYDALLLESTLASMLNLTYCPRPTCRYPVSVDSDTTLASCPSCNFHFCLLCQATYHGVAPCKMSSDDKKKLFESYSNGTESEKEALEKRYGKKQLISMMNDIQAEMWIGQHSKQCPHCNAPIEKKDGCNKMSCPRCNTFFCWICMDQLDSNLPYLHYSRSGAKCNLFEGLIRDEDDNDRDWINANADFDDDDDDDFIDDDSDDDDLEGIIQFL